jgi:hypothetical protein
MRMREQHGINFLGIKGEMAISLKSFLAASLEKTALEQQALSINFQKMLRPGYRLGRAMKSNPHQFILL